MIEFKNLVKSFSGRVVLKNLNLKIERGHIVFILGTSGTGKSVLLKNLVGLMKPDAGEIWLDGEEISKFSEDELFPVRRKCGMVFQHPALFDSLSVFDNVAFGIRRHLRCTEDEVAQKVREALTSVRLSELDDRYPAQLSYGMQKRVSLARTIALKPKVLLFDEPTTGLDPVTTKAINRLIQELSKNLQTTSVIVSHDMNCALEIADRIIVLDQGHIVDQGSPRELRRSKAPLVQEFLRETLAEDSP